MKTSGLYWVVLAMFIAGLRQVAVAEAFAADAPADAPAAEVISLPMPESALSEADDRVTLTLDNVPLEDVIRMFMRIPGVNFITSPTNLVGSVTVNLTDVPWQPALVSILATHNLTLIEKTPGSNIYSIEHRRPDAPEPLEVETLFLNFATVNEVRTALEPVLIAQARLSLFPSRNALIVKTTAANMREVKTVVDTIDKMREQVFIEAKFMELNDDAIQTLGVNWESLRGIGLSAGNIGWSYQRGRQRDRDSTWRYEEGYLESAEDRQTMRFDSEGQLIDQPEIEFITDQFGNVSVREVPVPITSREDVRRTYREGERTLSDVYSSAASDLRTAVLGMTDFNLILSALRETDGVSVVSNPKIVVANEEKATIHIGQTERPFISTVTPATDSSAPFTTYNPGDPVEFGVKLDVTPTVNTSSNISLLIEPTLTRFVRDAVAPTGQTYPIIARKRISTRFTLEDGKTVAIGGLTETKDDERVRKVPLLGDIPLIGRYLFTHSRKERRQTETVIFVTVGMASPHHIERDQGLPSGARLTQRQYLRQQLQRHEQQQAIETLRHAVEQTIAPSPMPDQAEGIDPETGEAAPPVSAPEPDPAIAEQIRRAFGR